MEACIDCKRDTSFGSGLFVNRIPADDGYMCPDCQSVECDVCGELSLDWSFPDGHTLTCDDCCGEE
jgi:hypothetical protein